MLYLEKGNLTEILGMNYWRFLQILETWKKINAIKSGKPVITKGVPRSSKDMIERRKQQR